MQIEIRGWTLHHTNPNAAKMQGYWWHHMFPAWTTPQKIMILVNRCKSMKWRNMKKPNCKPTPINIRQLQSFSRYFLRLRFGSPKQHKQNHLWPHIKIKYSGKSQKSEPIWNITEFGIRTGPPSISAPSWIPLRVSGNVSGCQGTMDDWGDAPRADAVGAPAAVLLGHRAPPAAGCTSTGPGWPRGPQGTPGDGVGGWPWPRWGWMIWYDLIWTDVMWLWCLRIRLIRSLGLGTCCDTKLGAPDIYSSWRCHGNGAPDIIHLHQS